MSNLPSRGREAVIFYMGVSQNMGALLVPIIRIVIYWGLYWGTPNFGKLPYVFGAV